MVKGCVSLFQDCQLVSSTVQPRLLAILSEQLYYDEIAIPFTRMQNECKQLLSLLADSNIDLQDRLHASVFTIDQANELVSPPRTPVAGALRPPWTRPGGPGTRSQMPGSPGPLALRLTLTPSLSPRPLVS